ncbi:Domain of uncharacterised function (DUF2825) [Salmonella enterica subsp. enterica]|nr:Domain of uncharacterised function (DUF2825) [Salmonella enterica subsp. enterica]
MLSRRRFWFRRFIPAGAGNTLVAVFTLSYSPVYPRWRGEHVTGYRAIIFRAGLSPLARGTQRVFVRPDTVTRFIPAGAGNTACDIELEHVNAVYPRWRGEHPTQYAVAPPVCGLSPLARGTRRSLCLRKLWVRFIPAGAGNTDCFLRCDTPLPVYPRWRGEHDGPRYKAIGNSGLSPLARGTL